MNQLRKLLPYFTLAVAAVVAMTGVSAFADGDPVSTLSGAIDTTTALTNIATAVGAVIATCIGFFGVCVAVKALYRWVRRSIGG